MRIAAVLLATLLVAVPGAYGWNATGHYVIAAIAYDHLTPSTKARVDDLIRRHPDYEAIFSKGAPADPVGRARAAFITASYWPDVIRNDPRFYDNTRVNAQPTPILPGFPEMARHTNWHYADFNFSQDGTPFPPLETPNALTELHRLTDVIAGAVGVDSSYGLPWLLHLAGDIHNPLHAVSRYSKALPKGDRGGNDVIIQPEPNLHAFWDGVGGSDPGQAYVDATANAIIGEYKANNRSLRLETSPDRWATEGFNIARSKVYKFGLTSGSKEHPVTLSKGYRKTAKSLGRQRLSIAGLRLADLLNRQLQ